MKMIRRTGIYSVSRHRSNKVIYEKTSNDKSISRCWAWNFKKSSGYSRNTNIWYGSALKHRFYSI